MAVALEHFGQPRAVTKQSIDVPIFGSHWVYELVVTTVWVDEDLPQRVPYRFKTWSAMDSMGIG